MENCPKCDSNNIRIQVPVGVSAPIELNSRFSKSIFNRKDVQLTHVNWECATHICVNCRHTNDGYGNYVSRNQTALDNISEVIDSDRDPYTMIERIATILEKVKYENRNKNNGQ